MKIFKKKRYEFFILEANNGNVNERLDDLSSRGWEVAGEACVKAL